MVQKSKSLDYEKLALVNTHILIIGEGGTGKETLARYIHGLSKKKSESFISSNLAALNSEEQDRELFGNEENHIIRYGLLEVAKGGVLFLKELASLNPGGQARLVKAIEDGVFFRCGGSKPLVFNTRIIASSRNPLEPLLESGKFRDDLYYLLNVAPILLPPLRARIEELQSFISFFSNQLCEIEKLKPRHFSEGAMDRLKQHEWPGNIRELKNLIHRLFITGVSPTIEDDELNPILSKQSEIASSLDSSLFTLPLKKARLEFEKIYLEKQLKIFENNVSKVSEFIGVERTHLYRKLRNLNVSTKTQKKPENL
ncbi:sigma 54-interacting transcriptional regulator [Pseudomonadota bacterium]|nr:sigma 54-interacting transcriptional regulator [Pseudomonadota bacterium]